jgi:hypothetical protein
MGIFENFGQKANKIFFYFSKKLFFFLFFRANRLCRTRTSCPTALVSVPTFYRDWESDPGIGSFAPFSVCFSNDISKSSSLHNTASVSRLVFFVYIIYNVTLCNYQYFELYISTIYVAILFLLNNNRININK